MSTIRPLALYQIETFGAGLGRHSSRNPEHEARPEAVKARDAQKEPAMRPHALPNRKTEFLVQLMVGGDQDLRKVIGRQDVAERREAAYSAALSNRPSARPLSFVRVIGEA